MYPIITRIMLSLNYGSIILFFFNLFFPLSSIAQIKITYPKLNEEKVYQSLLEDANKITKDTVLKETILLHANAYKKAYINNEKCFFPQGNEYTTIKLYKIGSSGEQLFIKKLNQRQANELVFFINDPRNRIYTDFSKHTLDSSPLFSISFMTYDTSAKLEFPVAEVYINCEGLKAGYLMDHLPVKKTLIQIKNPFPIHKKFSHLLKKLNIHLACN